MSLRLLVCGNRDWTCRVTIEAWLAPFHARWKRQGGETPLLIHGACGKRDARGRAVEGADELAHDVVFPWGWRLQACPANWDLHGKAAGPIRNQEMAERWQPMRALAFGSLLRDHVSNLKPHLTGTGNMVAILNAAGVPVTIVPRAGLRP